MLDQAIAAGRRGARPARRPGPAPVLGPSCRSDPKVGGCEGTGFGTEFGSLRVGNTEPRPVGIEPVDVAAILGRSWRRCGQVRGDGGAEPGARLRTDRPRAVTCEEKYATLSHGSNRRIHLGLRVGFASKASVGMREYSHRSQTTLHGLTRQDLAANRFPRLPSRGPIEALAVAPPVGRVRYGVAARVDRLGCIGNGEVPRVAALAWRMLTESEERR